MASSAGIDRLRTAVIDGQADNIRFRQNELQSLHQTLRENAYKVRLAITKDNYGDPTTEVSVDAEAEFAHTMSAVRDFYSGLDFEKSHHDEYLLANDADNPSRRVGKGIVVIKPVTHTRLYSIVCPIAAAITAGNCVFLELQDTLLNVDRVLKEILPEALDMDTFHISNTPLQDLSSAFLVDQASKTIHPTTNQLLSHSSARTIAIVDRVADIELAAKTIITARFSFQGSSPYSPDLIIVNDFVKAKFTEACIQYASKFFTAKTQSRRHQISSLTKEAFKNAEEKDQISVFGSSDFVLADLKDRSSSILKMKVSGCYLPIIESTSLVDAVMSQKSESPLLAVYIFSDPPTAKFLSQHLNAIATYVNQIPTHLLLGPAAPITASTTPIPHKYSVDMFSSSRPQYISPPPKDLLALSKVIEGAVSGTSEEVLRAVRDKAVRPLPKTGQPLGHAVGFFEQGIFIGVGLFLSLAIPSVLYGTWVLGRSAWRLTRR